MQLIRMITFITVMILPETVAARGGDAMRCDRAASVASGEMGVPLEVLLAISRVEAGRRVDGRHVAWPWTVNEAGNGAFFSSQQDAVAHVSAAMAAGSSNIDIGCFQVNLHWHGRAFSSLQAMFEPETNARYAASFLQKLYDELGGWDAAIGAYHSRKADAADRYLSKVTAAMGEHRDAPASNSAPVPLVGGGAQGQFGSLFAIDAGHNAMPLFR